VDAGGGQLFSGQSVNHLLFLTKALIDTMMYTTVETIEISSLSCAWVHGEGKWLGSRPGWYRVSVHDNCVFFMLPVYLLRGAWFTWKVG
jgi:hypothetical protein